MREFGIKFIFKCYDQNPVSQRTLHQIRREVAEVLRSCDFGDIIELPDGRFENQWARPAVDEYDPADNELLITYYWAYPLAHGSLWLFYTNHLSPLYQFSNNLNMPLTFRSQYN